MSRVPHSGPVTAFGEPGAADEGIPVEDGSPAARLPDVPGPESSPDETPAGPVAAELAGAVDCRQILEQLPNGQETILASIRELLRTLQGESRDIILSEGARSQLAREIAKELDPVVQMAGMAKVPDSSDVARIEAAAMELTDMLRIHNADFCRWRDVHDRRSGRLRWGAWILVCSLGAVLAFSVMSGLPQGFVSEREDMAGPVPASVLTAVRQCLDEARLRQETLDCRLRIDP